MSSRIVQEGLNDERNKKFMERGFPPGPTKAAAKKINLKDIHEYTKLHEEFGDVVMLPLGEVPLVFTRDPDMIKSVLGGAATEDFPRPKGVLENISILFNRAQIALDGAEHRNNKRMLSQFLFNTKHHAVMMNPIQKIVVDFVDKIKADYEIRNDVEVYSVAELAAADISAAISMGRSYNALQNGYCSQLDALKVCDKIFLNRAMNKKWRETEPKHITEKFERNKKHIADTFSEAYARIKGGATVDYNILSHMIEANLLSRSPECPHGKVPTELEAVSNMVGFLAGVGNTARMITIMFEMLALHQDVQTNVLTELHEVLNNKSPEEARRLAEKGEGIPGSRNQNLYSHANLVKLEYLKCVMYECLRLYTPSTSVAPRESTKVSQLGKFNIPSGVKVMCNIYGAHRDPKKWPDPERFDPMRFNEAKPGEPIRAKGYIDAFFAFGYGGHSCIGRGLAQLLAIGCWAMTVANYRVTKTPGREDAVFNTLLSDQILGFIEPINGCHISIKPRPVDAELDQKVSDELFLGAQERKAAEMTAVLELKKQQLSQKKDYTQRQIPMEEVQKHVSAETGYWFVINGKVYEVDEWLDRHPGGGQVLINCAGKDVTKLFEITNHSTFAMEEAELFQIGVLAPSPKL